MEAKIIEIITMESIALMLFVFAYAIGVMKKLELIAGYNERTSGQVKDKDGLARLVARVCLLVGLASALMPLVTHFWGTRERPLPCGSAVTGASLPGSWHSPCFRPATIPCPEKNAGKK